MYVCVYTTVLLVTEYAPCMVRARSATKKKHFHYFKVIEKSNVNINVGNYYDICQNIINISSCATTSLEGTMSYTHNLSKYYGR